MTLNVDKESITLIQIINDNAFDWLDFTEMNAVHYNHPRINFIWQVLVLTIKYPQVESYLKNILNYFTVNELENITGSYSILHFMCSYPFNISLNSFEMIINYGININFVDNYNRIAANQLFYNRCNDHIYNILNLLIKYNVNLNNPTSVLDILTYIQMELDEETKNCIITMIDFGGMTKNPRKNNATYDFIEYYRCSSVKPAIKNENKI